MIFDKLIIIQKMNESTEQWADVFTPHAKVNKTKGSEYLSAGANQSKSTRIFELRYFKALEDIDQNRGLYRVIYRGNVYNIVDYDDFQERHETVKLQGVNC
ncbi:MAG: phage head closure protein [Lachnospiraceae bacterium]|nr:phage head closure protein [Lachnospiraceae bacterium]